MKLTSLLILLGATAAMAKPYRIYARGGGNGGDGGSGGSGTGGNGTGGAGGSGTGGNGTGGAGGNGGDGGSGDGTVPGTGTGTGSGSGSSPGGGGGNSTYIACTDVTYKTPQCCAVDVLGVADLNCINPSAAPTSASNFKSLCSASGQQARCCVLPVLGQDILCQDPVGV